MAWKAAVSLDKLNALDAGEGAIVDARRILEHGVATFLERVDVPAVSELLRQAEKQLLELRCTVMKSMQRTPLLTS